MAPKKSSKATLKKAGTMATTAAVRKMNQQYDVFFFDRIIQAGREYLKQAWGDEKLSRVNAYLNARDTSDTSNDDEAPTAPSTTTSATGTTTTTVSSSTSAKTKAKPKLSKARTMKTTAKVC